jgi:hypothetical protein
MEQILTNDEKLLLETVIRDKLKVQLQMLPNMVRVSALNNPKLKHVSTKTIKETIKDITKKAPLSERKPRTIEGKIQKVAAMDRTYGKVIANNRKMTKPRAAYRIVLFLLRQAYKDNVLFPELIETMFSRVRLYPALAMYVDKIPLENKKRFFISEKDLIKGKGGKMIAINKQWTNKQYKLVEKIAKNNGFDVFDEGQNI